MRNGVAGAVGVGAVGAVGGGEQPDPEFVRRGIRFLRGTYSHPVAVHVSLIPSEPSRIEKSVIRRPRTFLLGYVRASGTSERREPETSLFVLIARRMEPERSGSSSQRPLGLSSRVAFWYLRSVLPVSSNGRLSARLPETDGSHPVPQGERDPLIEQVGHSIDVRAH
jgi:hypothetical protein